jgi:hypothetical protein
MMFVCVNVKCKIAQQSDRIPPYPPESPPPVITTVQQRNKNNVELSILNEKWQINACGKDEIQKMHLGFFHKVYQAIVSIRKERYCILNAIFNQLSVQIFTAIQVVEITDTYCESSLLNIPPPPPCLPPLGHPNHVMATTIYVPIRGT